MARHETNFEAAEEAGLAAGEARSLVGDTEAPPSRKHALACFLSAAEGWDKAARRLSGAFAEVPPPGGEKD